MISFIKLRNLNVKLMKGSNIMNKDVFLREEKYCANMLEIGRASCRERV